MTGDEVVEKWIEWTNRKDFILQVGPSFYIGLRLGQYLMNELARLSPNIEACIVGSHADPFHQDSRIPEFLRLVDDHFARNEKVCRQLERLRNGS